MSKGNKKKFLQQNNSLVAVLWGGLFPASVDAFELLNMVCYWLRCWIYMIWQRAAEDVLERRDIPSKARGTMTFVSANQLLG